MPPFPDFEGPSYVRIHVISPLSMVAGLSSRALPCVQTTAAKLWNRKRPMGAEASERSSVSLDQRHLMKAIFGGWKREEREGHICPHPSNPTAAGEQPLDPNKWHNSESPQTVANHFLLSLANTTITHIMNHQWPSESPIGLQLTSWL